MLPGNTADATVLLPVVDRLRQRLDHDVQANIYKAS
jgi:hypothetical protein